MSTYLVNVKVFSFGEQVLLYGSLTAARLFRYVGQSQQHGDLCAAQVSPAFPLLPVLTAFFLKTQLLACVLHPPSFTPHPHILSSNTSGNFLKSHLTFYYWGRGHTCRSMSLEVRGYFWGGVFGSLFLILSELCG